MAIIISYDVSDKNPQMKEELTSKGYLDRWDSNKTTYYLPDTTLWHPDEKKTVVQGVQDMKEAAEKLKIKLQRALAVPANPWSAITGDPHS